MQPTGYEQHLTPEERIALGEANVRVVELMQRAPRGGRGCRRRWNRLIARANLVASEIIARAKAREEAQVRTMSVEKARRRAEEMRREAEAAERARKAEELGQRNKELKPHGLRVCPECDRETGRSSSRCQYCGKYIGFQVD